MGESKVCICCNEEKLLEFFYRHKGMSDGHLGKCKECQKENSKLNYRKNIKARVQYEKERFQRPERKQKAKQYQAVMREREPEKYKARYAVSNALRDRRLFKSPCHDCGSEKVQAHHEDYSKPLNVTWLCRPCHLRRHEKISYETI